jgi:hypothetical protein
MAGWFDRERFTARVHPADRAVWLILAVAVALCLLRLPVVGPRLRPPLFVHALLLAVFTVYMAVAATSRARWIPQVLRPVMTVGAAFTLYATLGHLGLAAMPRADAALSWVDTRLLGVSPLALEPMQTPGVVEAFSVPYALFIPYIYLSAVLGTVGRPPVERDAFLTGWMLTYAISFVGYLFLPAQGPAAFHAADYAAPLHGGTFHGLVVRGVAATGGLFGAFPSLHVGSSLYLCAFDLRTSRLRGLTYLPVVAAICVATVVLRYHYVIDLVAGTLIALACVRLGPAQVRRWVCARAAQGWTPVPGEDAHAVLGLPAPGSPRA